MTKSCQELLPRAAAACSVSTCILLALKHVSLSISKACRVLTRHYQPQLWPPEHQVVDGAQQAVLDVRRVVGEHRADDGRRPVDARVDGHANGAGRHALAHRIVRGGPGDDQARREVAPWLVALRRVALHADLVVEPAVVVRQRQRPIAMLQAL